MNLTLVELAILLAISKGPVTIAQIHEVLDAAFASQMLRLQNDIGDLVGNAIANGYATRDTSGRFILSAFARRRLHAQRKLLATIVELAK